MWFHPEMPAAVLPVDPFAAVIKPAANVASLTVEVPAAAEIWLEGVKTKQAGTMRTFVSPELTPGKEYTYEIRGRWLENGKEIQQTRNVVVHAGDQLPHSLPWLAGTGNPVRTQTRICES